MGRWGCRSGHQHRPQPFSSAADLGALRRRPTCSSSTPPKGSPWARDALVALARLRAGQGERRGTPGSVDAQWPAPVVVPLEEVERRAPVLGRLGDGPTAVPVLGMASRDASVDVTALALGVTDLLTYLCNSEDLVDRVESSMWGAAAAA